MPVVLSRSQVRNIGCSTLDYLIINYAGSSLASRTRIKTLAYDTILANARFFNNDISAVPRMALTVGVATVLDSREVVIAVTGLRKALALSKGIGTSSYCGRIGYTTEHGMVVY
jgi:hypothetical protein